MDNNIYAFWKSMYEKSAEEQGQALLRRLESCLDFHSWGFEKSYTKFSGGNLDIIYDSEWCRVNFQYRRGRYKEPKLDEFSIVYGRLHAPDDQATMIWQGHKCNCWHSNRLTLFLLDGFTPKEVVQWEKDGSWLCEFKEQFRLSETGNKLISAELWAEHWIQSESATWKQYGQRLFEVFDLRQPDLWDEYSRFVEEYHRLIGTPPPGERIADIVAPQDHIC